MHIPAPKAPRDSDIPVAVPSSSAGPSSEPSPSSEGPVPLVDEDEAGPPQADETLGRMSAPPCCMVAPTAIGRVAFSNSPFVSSLQPFDCSRVRPALD